jgi:hypothetical protein
VQHVDIQTDQHHYNNRTTNPNNQNNHNQAMNNCLHHSHRNIPSQLNKNEQMLLQPQIIHTTPIRLILSCHHPYHN